MEILKVIKKKQPTQNQTKKSDKSSSQSQERSSNSSTNPSEISELDKPENYFYQAIGWLWATVAETEEGYLQITLLDGNSFDYKAPPKLLKVIKQHILDAPEKPLWLLCYPIFNLQSKVLSFRGVNSKKEQPPEAESGVFTLRGVWHFIKFNRNPVFSIYRNTLKYPKDRVKNHHLPLVGLDETPFNKETDPPEDKKFYQIQARLNPSQGCFEWVRNLAPPFHPPPPKLEKTAKFQGKPKDSKTDNKQKKSSAEVDKSTKNSEKTLVKEEKELHPQIQRLNREQMSKMMGISLSKLSRLTKEASSQSNPPIISHEGKQWRYISNPEGRGKVFEMIFE